MDWTENLRQQRLTRVEKIPQEISETEAALNKAREDGNFSKRISEIEQEISTLFEQYGNVLTFGVGSGLLKIDYFCAKNFMPFFIALRRGFLP